MRSHIKIAEVEVPRNIWELPEDKRLEITIAVKEYLERVIRRELRANYDKRPFLIKLLESSIIVNEEAEQYEICSVMKDIKDMIENEQVY